MHYVIRIIAMVVGLALLGISFNLIVEGKHPLFILLAFWGGGIYMWGQIYQERGN